MGMPKVGIVSFTDPRAVSLSREAENYNRKSHKDLAKFLKENGCEVIDPCMEMFGENGFFGVRTNAEIEKISKKLIERGAECVIIGAWKWTEPMLVIKLVRKLDLPVLLFTNADTEWTGLGCMSSIGASLLDAPVNTHALNHCRIYGDKARAFKWVNGVSSLQKMKSASFLLWGGTYCLRMEHLQDDIPYLKSFLVGEILSEDQYMLVKKAEDTLKNNSKRINGFIDWLKKNKTNMVFDDKMLTQNSLRRQIALYFAAKDRINELKKEENLLGVSIKCQPELSEVYGVTACFLPAFIPFAEDSESEKALLNCACEGDIKGMITSSILTLFSGGIPALFGDIRDIKVNNKRIFAIGNCGAASVYYAANSLNPKKVLPNVNIKGQCQGASGAAVGFMGRKAKVTLARMARINREYIMHYGTFNMIDVTPKMIEQFRWAKMWPVNIIDLPMGEVAETLLSNHYSLVPGDFSKEMEYFCKEAGIKAVKIV